MEMLAMQDNCFTESLLNTYLQLLFPSGNHECLIDLLYLELEIDYVC